MPTEKICPTCGKPLDENALMGLCPECLLRAGFGTIDTRPDDAAKSPAFVPPTPEELARFFPDLEIIELLGRGGMGAVYKARQKRLERLVALKILPPGIGQAPSFAERFEREAKALAQLHHPNIVTLYDSGQVDGLFYFFMEFVDGVNLRQLLDHGRLSPKEALAIVPQICDALQFAHDRGIIHRDIKPENILLNKAGQVKIADFGVAKIVAREIPETTGISPAPELGQTEAGKVIGTPQYMAPEQLSHPLDVDNRADIYALGVVFYQMLTGELPAGKFEPPSRKAQTDVRLDEVVQRALEKKPELRYPQASVMKTRVETIAATEHHPNAIPPAGPGFAPDPNRSRWKILIWGFGLAAACVEMAINVTPVEYALAIGIWGVLLFVISAALALVSDGNMAKIKLAAQIVTIDGIGAAAAAIWCAFNTPRLEDAWCYAIILACVGGIVYALRALSIWSHYQPPATVIPAGTPQDKSSSAPEHQLLDFTGILKFQSLLALNIARVASLGCLGFLGCLGYIPGWERLLGLFGLFGLFGFIGVAYMIEAFARTDANPSGSASRRLEREVPGPSRFSRTAIVGAAWSPFFFAAAAFLRFEHRTSFPDGYNLVAQLLIFLSFGACFGTTILGWTAVSQIHRSAGKLCGLGLALFDGLFFPLLALDYAIAFFINSAGIAFHLWTQEYDEVSNSWLTILSVIAWIIVDFIMIRWCWRAVNKPVETIAGSGAPPFQSSSGNRSRADRYVGPIMRWLSIAFSVFALTVLSGIFYTYEVLPKVYSANAEIQVMPRHPANPNGIDSSPDSNPLQSEIEIMQSPDFLAPIITDLNLNKIWAKRVYHSGLDTLPDQDAISYLQSILKIDVVRGTNIVRITAFSEVPQEAADIANAVADRYITVRTKEMHDAVKDAEKRLTDQIAQQQKTVDDATANVAKIRQDLAQKGIAIPSEIQADLDARQKDLLSAQEDYDARRVLMQSVNNLPDDQFILTLDSLGRLPPDIAALRLDVLKENTDITGLLNNGFSEGHPQIVALRAKVAAEEQEIKHLVAGSRNNLKADAEMAKSRVDLFQKEVDDLKNKTALGDASNALMPFSEALRNLEEQQKELDLLQVRLQQLDTENRLQEGSAAIVARAEPPEYPALPHHALNIAISVIVGFILSVGLASLVEFWFWLSAAPTVTTGDNKSPATPSLPQPASSPKGRTLALVGAILQPASILGGIFGALWQISGMESLRAQGSVGVSDVANVWGITLVASAVSMIAFFVGLILLCIALAVSRYRAKWFFWFLALYSWPLLLLFPFGTAAGVFFLIYCLSRRHEFPGA